MSPRTRAANGRSTIYQSQDGRWRGKVSMGIGLDGRPIRRDVRGATRAEVTAKVKELESRRDAGAVTFDSRTTVAAWLADWIGRRERLGAVRPLTIKGYRTDERHIVAAIGQVKLSKISAAHIDKLWESIVAEGLSVAHCRRTLNAALNEAVARGFLVRNPVKLAVAPRHAPARINPYTVEQMTRLLDAARDVRNAPRWTLAVALGLRQGEVLGLRWDDVDLTAGTLRIARQLQRLGWRHGCGDPAICLNRTGTKAKRGADCPQRWGGGLHLTEPKSEAGRRVLTLPPTLVRDLKAHRNSQAAESLACEIWVTAPDGGWVFPDPVGGPIDPRADAAAFKALCTAAGVPARRLHDLRHSAATLMLENDLDLRTAGVILGHSQIALTARYSHVVADRQAVAAGRIEEALFGARRRRTNRTVVKTVVSSPESPTPRAGPSL